MCRKQLIDVSLSRQCFSLSHSASLKINEKYIFKMKLLMRSSKCKTDASRVALAEAEVAGLEVSLSPHPRFLRGSPKLLGAQTPLKFLEGLVSLRGGEATTGRLLVAKFKSINFR